MAFQPDSELDPQTEQDIAITSQFVTKCFAHVLALLHYPPTTPSRGPLS